ncbi:MAG: hypothetical protein KDI51_01555, partial [Xanthomonadales bacterium]|nr:hypothetical protein [Xanthomonadales bacterium]
GVLLLLLVTCLTADFSMLEGHGYSGDDWGRIRHHYHETEHLHRFGLPYEIAYALKYAKYDGRPLLALSLLIEWQLYELGGRYLWSAVSAIILSFNAFLFFVLCRQQLPSSLALAAALLALLFPADTVHQWLTLGIGRLSYTCALLACIAYCRHKNVLATGLLLAAALWYEPAAVIFGVAPWFSSRGSWLDTRRAMITGVVAVAVWAVIRLALHDQGKVTESSANFGSLVGLVSSPEAAVMYLLNFPKAVFLTFVHWPIEAFAIVGNWGLFVSIMLAVAVAMAVAVLRNKSVVAPANLGRPERFPGVPSFDVEPSGGPWVYISAIGWGLLAIVLCALPSFILGPTGDWGAGTRGNYFLGFGFGMVVAGLCIMMMRMHKRIGVQISGGICMVFISIFLFARLEMQSRYVEQIAEQDRKIGNLLERIGEIPRGTLVLRVHEAEGCSGASRRMILAWNCVKNWEFEAVLQAFYGARVLVKDNWGRDGVSRPVHESAIAVDGDGKVHVLSISSGSVRYAPTEALLDELAR